MIIKPWFLRQLALCRNDTLKGGLVTNRLLIYMLLNLFSLGLAACGGTHDHAAGMVGHKAAGMGNTGTERPPVGTYQAKAITGDYAGYANLEQFIEVMTDKHGFERDYLKGLFSQAKRKDWTLNYLAKSDKTLKGKPSIGGWTRYRAKFLDKHHIEAGIEFAQMHRAALERASRQYKVPEEYILGILAVETIYGSNVGNHRVIDALTTLSFDYARRGEFFRSELEAFLLMSRSEGFDPAEPVGSFAGAMGLGQFMPSSFLKFAVDFNNDGRRDLWNAEDAIGSIANYFAQHGWKPGQPVVTPLQGNGTVDLEPGISTQYSLAEIEQAGLRPLHPGNTDDPVHLILLRHAKRDQYLIGFPNFYTITRYNHSVYYAMAVHELAQEIRHRAGIGSARYLGQTKPLTSKD